MSGKGMHLSEESKKRISDSMKGLKRTESYKIKFREKNNPYWKGENAGMSAMHKWVEKCKGKPKYCEDCGLNDPNRRYDWSNIDHKYRRILDDYVRRCISCHRKYDINLCDLSKNN